MTMRYGCLANTGLAAVGLVSQICFSASFNCNGGRLSTIEKSICADAQLSGLDSRLASVYSAEKARLLAPASLIEEQKAWIRRRNSCPNTQCLIELYYSRITELSQSAIVQPSAGAPVERAPSDFPSYVPPKSSIPVLLSGKWSIPGPNPTVGTISKETLDLGGCRQRYKVLDVGLDGYQVVAKLEVSTLPKLPDCTASRSFEEVSISSEEAQSGTVSGIWWTVCRSQADLEQYQKSHTNDGSSCFSFLITRED